MSLASKILSSMRLHISSNIRRVIVLSVSLILFASARTAIAQDDVQFLIGNGGVLVYSDDGRYVPIRWHDGTNMTVRSARAAYMGGNRYALIVVGGDGTLLYRVGPPSRMFFPDNGSAGWFTWNSGEKESRMKASKVVSVMGNRSGDLRIVVAGGDGRQCTLDSSPQLLGRTSYRDWDCF